MYQTQLAAITEEAVSHNPALFKRVLIGGNTLPGLNQFAVARFPAGECAPAHHHHDLYEIFLVLSGTGRMQVEQTEIALQHGCCISVAPGESHAICNTGEEELLLLYFSLPTGVATNRSGTSVTV